MSGHRHATISLICMSTHKAMAARCLSYHQATSRQPAIRALATAPLRRLALSVLFTIATNSYQTTCTVSERTFNKRQHTNARHGVDFSLFTHYDRWVPIPLWSMSGRVDTYTWTYRPQKGPGLEIPTPRKDMGPGIPTFSLGSRMTDRRLRKHYLSATTVAGGKKVEWSDFCEIFLLY